MADPVDYRLDEQGRQVPIYNQATPGIGGAFLDAIRALVGATAPRSIVQRKANVNQQVEQADPQALGNQIANQQ